MTGGELIGRERELAELTVALEQAVSGQGGLAVVTGEPGIGKTALVERAAAAAATRGFGVGTGACWPEGAPAFWPWTQALEQAAGTDSFPDLSGSGRPEATPDADGARFVLFERVVQHLRLEATKLPQLLVFEDVHWADRASLLLLAFAGRELRSAPVLMIATYRDDEVGSGHAVKETLGDLVRVGVRVPLRGLSQAGVARLIEEATGTVPSDVVASAVHRRTGGNPLFISETARLLGAEGRLAEPASWERAVPAAALDVITRRLARLSQPAHEALGAAAVVGRAFDLDILEAVSEVPGPELLDLLDEAGSARLIAPGPSGPSQWEFTHALVVEALDSTLSVRRRAELHARAAAALETLRTAALDEHLAEVANHWAQSLPIGDPTKAFELSRRAAARASAQLAYDEAVRHLRTALAVADRAGLEPTERMEVHLELGAALLRSGDREGAASAFDTAAGLARTVGVAEGVARAALGFGAGLGGFEVRMFDQRQIAMLEEALAALPDVDSGLRSRVLARLAVAVSFVADDARRVELADAAVQMARRLGDDDALASALAAHCDAIAGPAHVKTRLEESTEIVALARASGNRELELLGRRMRVVVRFEMGDRPALEREVDEYAAVAGGVGLPLYSWYATLWRGALALADGRIDDAKACNEEVDAVGAAGYSHNATMLAWVQRFVIARDSGRLPDVIPEVVEAMHTDPELASNPASQATTAAMREVAGEHRAASGVLDLLAGGLLARYADDSEWLPAMCSMAEAAWLCRHRSAAEVLYDVLAPYAGMWGVEGIGAGVHGAVDRHLGLLAHVLGNRPAARRHLEDALAAHRRFGAPLLAQRVVDDLAALGEQPAPAVANRFARDGDGWALTHRGRTVHVRDAKGLHDIAALLAVAGREVHVADLMGTVEATGRAGADVDLDDQARAAYRWRIVELQEELDEAEAAQDTGRAGSARAELEYLVAELSGALGLGGRSRRSGDPGERARKAVTNRIGNAIDRVERVHPELGRHLRRSITTGTFCSYQPEQPEPWVL